MGSHAKPWFEMKHANIRNDIMPSIKRSYEQVLKQIEDLKIEAENLRRSEVSGVVERIRHAISFYGLTAADLGLSGPAARGAGVVAPAKRKGRKKAGAKAPAVVKYRNEAGGTWGGIGKRPQWLRDALASGKTLEDFLVK
jgi:DNA-binding protein H-NS